MNEGGKKLEQALYGSNVGTEIKLVKKETSNVLIIAMVCIALIAGIAFGYFVGTNIYPPSLLTNNSNTSKPGDTAGLNQNIENYLTTNFLGQYNASAKISNYSLIGENLIQYNIAIVDTKNGTKMDEGTVYVTKDGVYMVNLMYNLSAPFPKAPEINNTTPEQPQVNLSKTDKPSVELYVFSYCPAGTAALDAYGNVGKLLANQTDMKVKFFSDMHGPHELQQNKIQDCIQTEAPSKYWDYVVEYVSKIYNICGGSRSIDCDKNESIKLMQSVGINPDTVMMCVAERGDTLYASDQSAASSYAMQYSPSIVVNGVSFGPDFERTPEGIKTLICSAFVNPPSECNQSAGSAAATTSSSSCS